MEVDKRGENKMKAECKIEVEFKDQKKLDAALKALSHEGSIGNRSKSEYSRVNNNLKIIIRAEDIVALRATVNAYLRALQTIESIENIQEVQ